MPFYSSTTLDNGNVYLLKCRDKFYLKNYDTLKEATRERDRFYLKHNLNN